MLPISRGDILKLEHIKGCVLVVSNNTFNQYENAIVCPISKDQQETALHIPIETSEVKGTVWCEQLKLLDLRVRGFSKVSELKYEDIMNITDAIQGIFDYAQ